MLIAGLVAEMKIVRQDVEPNDANTVLLPPLAGHGPVHADKVLWRNVDS